MAEHSKQQPSVAFWVAITYVGTGALMSGFLAGCGGPNALGTAVTISVLIAIIAAVILYFQAHTERTTIHRWLSAIIFAVALFSAASVLSSLVWVFYAKPSTALEPIEELKLVLLGQQCG